MKLQIPLTEVCCIAKEKTGQDVCLEIKDRNTIKLNYNAKIKIPLVGEVSKTVNCDLTVDAIDGEDELCSDAITVAHQHIKAKK